VACDGTRSRVRSTLFPESHTNYVLPVRLLGVSTVYPSALASKVRKLDPFFLQAGDPQTDAFHWFSFLDSPSNNSRSDSDSYECQILISWPYRAGFRGASEPLEVPGSNAGRLKLMKELASGWVDPFREIVSAIPDEAEVKTISLEDWVPPRKGWSGVKGRGRVVLVGDAAHAMTMCKSCHCPWSLHHIYSQLSSYIDFRLPMLMISKSGAKQPITGYWISPFCLNTSCLFSNQTRLTRPGLKKLVKSTCKK
jgi:2-polyprenyl-6-methoxyphenol hydroxylase-like FAD-dependent oxidoreductase